MSIIPLNTIIQRSTSELTASSVAPTKGIPAVDMLSYYLMGPTLNMQWQFEEDVIASSGTFTAVATTDIFTKSSHGFRTGIKVRVSNSGGALPTGLVAATDYYVIKIDANTFYLAESLTASSNPLAFIDITSNGTGTNTVTPQTVAGTAGTGTYLLTLPDSLMIDSNFVSVGTNKNANNVGSVYVIDSAGTPVEGLGYVTAYDTTHLAMVVNKVFVTDAYLGINSADKPVKYLLNARVPITLRNYLY